MAEPRLQALPFDEAIAALKTRADNPLPSGRWQEVAADEHAIAGTVARSASFDILGDIFGSMKETLEKGGTFASWKKDVVPILQAKGWWGKKVVDGEVVQFGSPHRLGTIFHANMRASYMSGRWEQIQRLKARRPYLRYVAVQDERTRQDHKTWHGTVLPVDDPWWSSHYPPNGWRCRCTVQQLSDRDLKRFGYTVSDAPPPGAMKAWRNPVTGDVVEVPEGIDPGWQRNVGQAREVGLAAMAKIDRLPAPAGAAAARSLPTADVRREFGGWAQAWIDAVDTAEAARNARLRAALKPQGETKAIGAIPPGILSALQANGLPVPETAAVWIDDRALIHLVRSSKAAARTSSDLPKALPREDVKRLPDALASPEAVYWDEREQTVVYVIRSVTAERPGDAPKVAVRVNARKKVKAAGEERRTVVRNEVVSAGWEQSFPAPRYIRLDDRG